VTRRAGRELLDFVFGHELSPKSELVRGRLIEGIENFIPWAHVFLRLPVAAEAPIHLQRLRAPGQRHLRDRPVASGAADPFIHVNAVVEVDEIGERIDARPFDRAVGAVRCGVEISKVQLWMCRLVCMEKLGLRVEI
jgi:hypothetical protein